MKIPIMSYAINLTFWLLVWLVPGEKFYGLGTGFQFQTIPVPLYVLNPMGLLCIPVLKRTTSRAQVRPLIDLAQMSLGMM